MTIMTHELEEISCKRLNYTIKKWGTELNKEFLTEKYLRAEKHLKKCSTSLVIREMQMQIHLTLVRMAKIKNSGDK